MDPNTLLRRGIIKTGLEKKQRDLRFSPDTPFGPGGPENPLGPVMPRVAGAPGGPCGPANPTAPLAPPSPFGPEMERYFHGIWKKEKNKSIC